tara:strand:+ start:2817 stop:3248 length:432 start_codon:yes stop_codon:yes gene_type:complete
MSEKVTILHIKSAKADLPTKIEADTIYEAAQILLKIIGEDHQSRMKRWSERKMESLETYTGRQYGWESKNGKLYPNWEEQHCILMMKALHKNGTSFNEIARLLNEMGKTTTKGRPFRSSTIGRIINRDIHDKIHQFDKPKGWD